MTTLSEILDRAVLARDAGDIDQAESLARAALAAFPDSDEAVFILTDLLRGQGRLGEARVVLERRLLTRSDHAGLQYQLACVLIEHERRQLDDGDLFTAFRFQFPWGEFPFPLRDRFAVSQMANATEMLRTCLAAEPNHGPANSLLGEILLSDEAQIPEAAERIQRGVQYAPNLASAHAAMGRLALRAGHFAVAVAAFDGAVSRDDTDRSSLTLRQLALVMDTQIDPETLGDGWRAAQFEACAEGLRLLCQNRGMSSVQQKLSMALSSRIAGQLIELAIDGVYADGSMVGAARLLDRAMMIDSHHPDAAVAMGALMLSINQFEAAEANLENAGKLGSTHPVRENLLAMTQLSLGKEVANATSLVSALDMRKLALAHCRAQDFKNAETWLRRAIDMDPTDVGAYADLSQVLTVMDRTEDAITVGEQALVEHPSDPRLRLSLYGHYLANTEPAKAWEMYESRFEVVRADTNRPQPSLPRWTGQELRGKRLLVWREEGVGDEVLFASLLPDFLKRWPCDVVFECSARLLPLLQRSLPKVVFQTEEGRADATGAADYHLPSGSLMMHVRPTLASYDGSTTFLIPDPKRVADFTARLRTLGPQPKIGLSWESLNMSWAKRPRTSVFADILPLLTVKGVLFVNLQLGDVSPDLARARTEFSVTIHNFSDLDLRNDLDGVAALMKALDRVATLRGWISTFAGMVGTETYCYSAPPNTYGLGQARCPWAPSIKFFSKNYGETWEGPMVAIAARLRELAAHG